MTESEELIHTFYTAFKNRDYGTMQECYSDSATFSDPVFRDLNARQVRSMWEMFLVKNESLTIEFSDIELIGEKVSAQWTARYTLSSTGRPVTNSIRSMFRIKDGKITRHTDNFNFYRWCRQALGLKGVLLGWSPMLKNRVRKTARTSLDRFVSQKES
jgi:ketosteroid isomerase-like protein